MTDRQLLIRQLLWRATRVFGDREVVTRVAGNYHRHTYADLGVRARQLAEALQALGVVAGDRVATLAWNTHKHLEAFFGVPCIGASLHTVNPRLFPAQINSIMNRTGDKVLLLDADQIPLVEQLASELKTIRAYVILDSSEASATSLSPVYDYEDLLTGQLGQLPWPDLHESTPAIICHTSGTTGDPKSVVYSHRTIVLNSLLLAVHGSLGIHQDHTFLSISPMFHATAAGVPYAAAMQGAKLVLPGIHPESQHYLELIEHERVTHAVSAVTVGVMMRHAIEGASRDYDLSSLEALWLGGQTPPQGLIDWWHNRYGVNVLVSWGMTETPATFLTARRGVSSGGASGTTQGLPLPLIELKVVNDAGKELPWDGESDGEYCVRAPTLACEDSEDPNYYDGWFHTGDIGVIDPDGYLQLTDRAKDMIKSGGEWISSVKLENALMSYPNVIEASVVAILHEQWLERPLACIVSTEPVSHQELNTYLAERFPRWWLPDDYVFLREIPRTSVGKFDKKLLRARFTDPANRQPLRHEP
ncbi:MAG: long-chain-fatty-acid--CoA ligase [Pseudonocardiaceae bacterium]